VTEHVNMVVEDKAFLVSSSSQSNQIAKIRKKPCGTSRRRAIRSEHSNSNIIGYGVVTRAVNLTTNAKETRTRLACLTPTYHDSNSNSN
jgi:hypothetical protein